MFCGRCGKELKEGAAFCGNCGAPVEKTGQQAAGVQSAAGARPEAATLSQPVTQQAAGKPGKAKRDKKPAKAERGKKKRGKTAAIVVTTLLVVLLAAVGITGAVLYFTGDAYQCEKRLEAADKLYEEGRYEEALAAYTEVLELNAGLAEPYLRCADIYLSQNGYAEAVKLLNRANRRTNWQVEEIDGKLEEVYLNAALYYAQEREYGQAYDMLEQGIRETGSALLSAQKVKIYLAEEEFYLAEGSYEQALQVLEKGAADTGDGSLEAEQVNVYIRMADAALQAGDYVQALSVLDRGIAKTGASSLEEQKVQVYLAKSDRLLADGAYTEAVQALEDGEKDTGASQLAERGTYLRENIVIAGVTIYNYGTLMARDEYDSDGRLVRDTGYNTDGTVSYITEYTYSADGNTISGKCSYYDMEGNLIYRSETEEILDAAGQRIKESAAYYDIDGNMESRYETENTYTYENDRPTRCDSRSVTYDMYGGEFQTSSATVYAYDENGNLQITRYDESGAETFSEQVTYDGKGNILQVQGTSYDGNGVQRWWECTYNILGYPAVCSSTSWWNAEGSYAHEYVYEYRYKGQ